METKIQLGKRTVSAKTKTVEIGRFLHFVRNVLILEFFGTKITVQPLI